MQRPGYAAEWTQVSVLLDELLELPVAERAAALRKCALPDAIRNEVMTLLQASGAAAAVSFLERASPLPDASRDYASLAAGTRLGSFSIVQLIGRGGMGEVYLAERIDGGFTQRAAIKLLRPELALQFARLENERRILASLEHPNIARLLDGGLAPDGRPFLAMEYVAGDTLTEYCARCSPALEFRFELFLALCEAVAHAHRQLVVHRDLKPGNVMVTTTGEVKLLDFGIARLLEPESMVAEPATLALLTPDYAAPEQLAGERATVAADVYALGAVLYELLVGHGPWRSGSNEPVTPLQRLLQETAIAPSLAAARAVGGYTGAPPARLRGDLDAIVQKALRPRPADRYPDAGQLAEDLRRHLRHEPVHARSGARAYVARRFLRRHWLPSAAVAFALLALGAGAAAFAWQAQRAQVEARRANATRDFLVGLFRASDPRVAEDQPRATITVRALLDRGAERVATEFAGDPATQLELLGVIGDALRELGEDARYKQLEAQRVDLARRTYGPTHPVIVTAALDQAAAALESNETTTALAAVTQAETLIRQGGHERSVLQARALALRGMSLMPDVNAATASRAALEAAVALYARVAPTDAGRVSALNDLGVWLQNGLKYADAAIRYREALAVAERVPPLSRNDAERLVIYFNLSRALLLQNDIAGADATFDAAERLARQTYGESHHSYWAVAANRARWLHLRGERERADALFKKLLANLPAEPKPAQLYNAAEAREWYGYCLAAEGRAFDAIEPLEYAERVYLAQPRFSYDLPRVRLTLGDAYERAGRLDDARRTLYAALQQRAADGPADFQPLLAARERWGRYLLARGDLPGAEEQFREVIEQSGDRRLAHTALAHGGVALIAIARQELPLADLASRAAVDTIAAVEGFIDVRMEPYLWRIRAEVLTASGDAAAAGEWRRRAPVASERYDAPGASTRTETAGALASLAAVR